MCCSCHSNDLHLPITLDEYEKISDINNWKHLFNYINKHQENTQSAVHLCLNNHLVFTPQLVEWLATSGLIAPEEYDTLFERAKDLKMHVEVGQKVATIKHWKHLFNYIKKHPETIHDAINWAHESIFTKELVDSLYDYSLISESERDVILDNF